MCTARSRWLCAGLTRIGLELSLGLPDQDAMVDRMPATLAQRPRSMPQPASLSRGCARRPPGLLHEDLRPHCTNDDSSSTTPLPVIRIARVAPSLTLACELGLYETGELGSRNRVGRCDQGSVDTSWGNWTVDGGCWRCSKIISSRVAVAPSQLNGSHRWSASGGLASHARHSAAASMDFLKSAVASAISKGPPFPYTFGDRVDVESSAWTLHNGTRRVSSPSHERRRR